MSRNTDDSLLFYRTFYFKNSLFRNLGSSLFKEATTFTSSFLYLFHDCFKGKKTAVARSNGILGSIRHATTRLCTKAVAYIKYVKSWAIPTCPHSESYQSTIKQFWKILVFYVKYVHWKNCAKRGGTILVKKINFKILNEYLTILQLYFATSFAGKNHRRCHYYGGCLADYVYEEKQRHWNLISKANGGQSLTQFWACGTVRWSTKVNFIDEGEDIF